MLHEPIHYTQSCQLDDLIYDLGPRDGIWIVFVSARLSGQFLVQF